MMIYFTLALSFQAIKTFFCFLIILVFLKHSWEKLMLSGEITPRMMELAKYFEVQEE